MKNLLIFLLLLSSCRISVESQYVIDYNNRCVDTFRDMKPPIVLDNKLYYGEVVTGIILMDGDSVEHMMGDLSAFARWLGDNYEIGDTIIK